MEAQSAARRRLSQRLAETKAISALRSRKGAVELHSECSHFWRGQDHRELEYRGCRSRSGRLRAGIGIPDQGHGLPGAADKANGPLRSHFNR